MPLLLVVMHLLLIASCQYVLNVYLSYNIANSILLRMISLIEEQLAEAHLEALSDC